MTYLITQRAIPRPFAFLAICAEFFGSLGLILRLLRSIVAIGITIDMTVAIIKVHILLGFLMNWNSNKAGERFEFHILTVAMALAIMIGGARVFFLDHFRGPSRRVRRAFQIF